MLAIAEQELLAPGVRFRDVHMDVLSSLQPDQDQRPQHGMRRREANHQPQAGLRIAGAARPATPPSRRTERRRLERATAGETDVLDMTPCVARFRVQVETAWRLVRLQHRFHLPRSSGR